jgi:hypothetical protein
VANEQTLIQWLLDQHDDPPDYTPDEAVEGEEAIETAVREARQPVIAVDPAGRPERPDVRSQESAEPFQGPRASGAEADPDVRRPVSGPSAIPDFAERFSRQQVEVTTPGRLSAEAANFVEAARRSGDVARAEIAERQSGPAAEVQTPSKQSSPFAFPEERQVRFFIPPNFPVDANELFALADRDIPVNEEGSLDKQTSVDQAPKIDYPIPTDQLVVEVNQYNDSLDSREDRRVR